MQQRLLFIGIAVSNLITIFAILVFAAGFFPYKPFVPGENAFTLQEKSKIPKPPFDKVILMVVDALRSDFVFSGSSGFQFVQSLIRMRHGVPFTAHASSPTITMPKIKAITTGSVPSFLDVILNFAESDTTSTLAHTDTWLSQLKRMPNGKLLMYGDDTWLKLFPDFFERADGTSSFFVSDFTEVDNNVTRHVTSELENSDWNGWFMHYLGLDHIGHKSGPSSPHMIPKQREMDGIVKEIYESIESKAHLSSTLLILCGDHGMNDAGNHGGAAPGETSPALVFISPKFKMLPSKHEAPVDPLNEFDYYHTVEQSDIAATVSTLLGLPIPLNNLGVLIPEFLNIWNDDERLHLLGQNVRQIHGILEQTIGTDLFSNDSLSKVRCDTASTDIEYLQCGWLAQDPNADGYEFREEIMYRYLYTSQSLLSTTASNYDIPKLYAGISLAFTVFLINLTMTNCTLFDANDRSGYYFTIITTFLNGAMMFASSFVEEEHQYWYWMSALLAVYLFLFRPSRLQVSQQDILLCIIFLSIIRIVKRWNQTGQKFAGSADIGKTFLYTHSNILWATVTFTHAYFGGRLAYSKWPGASAHLGPYLATITTFCVLAFKTLFTVADAPELLGEIEAYLAHLATSSMLLAQARTVFVMTGALMIILLVSYHREHQSPDIAMQLRWLAALFLITETRVTNIPLIMLLELTTCAFQVKFRLWSSLSATELGVFSIIMQQTSFFAFGGTNSISSIDLSNAYNGVSGYNILAVGILTFVSNWVGPIWWAIVSGSQIKKCAPTRESVPIYIQTTGIFVSGSLLATMLACTFLRNHLFIWTVFSPKYLYIMAWSLAQNLFGNIVLTTLFGCNRH